jgi:hypothetical protein
MNRKKAIVFVACLLAGEAAHAQSSACDAVLVKTDVKYLSNDVLRLAYSYFLDQGTYDSNKTAIEGWYGAAGGTYDNLKKHSERKATGMKLNLTKESARAFLQTGLPSEAVQEWGRCMESQPVTLRVRELDNAGATIDFWYRPSTDPQKLPVQVFSDNLQPLDKGLVPAATLGKVTIPLMVKRSQAGEQAKLTIKVGNFGDSVTIPVVPKSCGESAPQEVFFKLFPRLFCFGGKKSGRPSVYTIPFDDRMLVSNVTIDAHDRYGRTSDAKLVLRFDGKTEGKKVGNVIKEEGLEVPNQLGQLAWNPNREAGHIDLVSKQRNDYAGGEETCLYKVRVEGYPAHAAACPSQRASEPVAGQSTKTQRQTKQ